jgi:hypothetical protein
MQSEKEVRRENVRTDHRWDQEQGSDPIALGWDLQPERCRAVSP